MRIWRIWEWLVKRWASPLESSTRRTKHCSIVCCSTEEVTWDTDEKEDIVRTDCLNRALINGVSWRPKEDAHALLMSIPNMMVYEKYLEWNYPLRRRVYVLLPTSRWNREWNILKRSIFYIVKETSGLNIWCKIGSLRLLDTHTKRSEIQTLDNEHISLRATGMTIVGMLHLRRDVFSAEQKSPRGPRRRGEPERSRLFCPCRIEPILGGIVLLRPLRN
jgi:hypothetical protein